MNQLIAAFESLFAAAITSGGELARTANFTLEKVDWTSRPSKPLSVSNPIVDRYLEVACKISGQYGSSSRIIAETLLAVTDQLQWRTPSRDCEDGPDMALFSGNYTSTCVVGEEGVLPSDKISAGFSLQGRDTYYPPHAHHAEESYWIIGGDGDWKVGTRPWFAVEPGDSIYHESGARHAMQTNELPLLAVWLWTSHLGSEVKIIRG
jgi:mannose-6-phosphate isomerase-like protein (cupin superfamily)